MTDKATQPINHLIEIKDYGQSIWMDNLTRDMIQSGELKQLIENEGVYGITSNRSIFEKALKGNAIYDADIEAGVRAGLPTYKIYESLIFEDIRHACDMTLHSKSNEQQIPSRNHK